MNTTSKAGRNRWTPIVGLMLALALLPGVASAKAYWFETYQRSVQLIDRDQVDEAAKLLDSLIETHPVPRADMRMPGNQYMDYLPYFQQARIQFRLGDYERAAHSLDVSEAFGAVKRNKRAMAELAEFRQQLTVKLAANRGA